MLIEHVIIGWLYAWGAVVTATFLAYANRINNEDGSAGIVGAVALAIVWPIFAPYMLVRWTPRIAKLITATKQG